MKYSNRPPSYIKRITNSPLTLIFFAILVFFLSKAAWGVHRKALVTETKLLQARAELTKLEDRQRILISRVDSLSTEEGLESEMRTKYRAVRDGELVAVIVDDKNSPTVATTSSVIYVNLWSKLLGLIGLRP